MRRLIAVIVLVGIIFGCVSCKPAPTAIKIPALGVLKKQPPKVASTALGDAFIQAADYCLRDYANKVKWNDNGVQYISMNTASIKTLKQKEKDDLSKFIQGYGIPFDQQGLDSGRTLTEQQKGIEMSIAESANLQFYEKEIDLYLEITLYTGEKGQGYFAYFKSYKNKYVLVECTNWLEFPYR